MSMLTYVRSVERKNELLDILDILKQDYEKVSHYSKFPIQQAIEQVEGELTYYRKPILNLSPDDPNTIYEVHYVNYTDEELADPEKIRKELQEVEAAARMAREMALKKGV